MGIMVSPELLRRYPFFASLDHESLVKFSKLGEAVDVSRDEWLFHGSEIADYFYVVIEGEVELMAPLGADTLERIPVTRLGRGELFGWSALIEPHIYQFDARAVRPGRVLRMSGVQVCAFLAHRPDIGCLMMSRICQVVGNRLNSLRVQFVSLIDGGRWQHFSAGRRQYIDEGGQAKPLERKS